MQGVKDNPELQDLVKLCQLPKHLKTFQKYENQVCRFIIGKSFNKIHKNLSQELKVLVSEKTKVHTNKVKDLINNYLNLSNQIFH